MRNSDYPVAEAFAHLGFPTIARGASCAKLLGLVLLLAPVPARLKEWAYAGFAIDLGSAVIAHLAVGDGPAGLGLGGGNRRMWGLWSFCWRRLEVSPAAIREAASTSRNLGAAAYREPGA